MTALIFITREKFSRAYRSLMSILPQLQQSSQVVVTDIGYPADVAFRLREALDGVPHCQWVKFPRFVLPNAQVNEAVATLADDGPVLVVENDVLFSAGAATAMTALIEAGEADIVSPLIMHADTGLPHYDPPVSIILHDETDGTYTSLVERIPRNGWLPVQGRRTVYHVERHAFACSASALRAIVPLNDQLNTREQIEFSLRAFDVGARMIFEPASVVSYYPPSPLEAMDRELFRWRWDEERAKYSNNYVCEHWSLRHFARSTNFVRRMNALLAEPADPR